MHHGVAEVDRPDGVAHAADPALGRADAEHDLCFWVVIGELLVIAGGRPVARRLGVTEDRVDVALAAADRLPLVEAAVHIHQQVAHVVARSEAEQLERHRLSCGGCAGEACSNYFHAAPRTGGQEGDLLITKARIRSLFTPNKPDLADRLRPGATAPLTS